MPPKARVGGRFQRRARAAARRLAGGNAPKEPPCPLVERLLQDFAWGDLSAARVQAYAAAAVASGLRHGLLQRLADVSPQNAARTIRSLPHMHGERFALVLSQRCRAISLQAGLPHGFAIAAPVDSLLCDWPTRRTRRLKCFLALLSSNRRLFLRRLSGLRRPLVGQVDSIVRPPQIDDACV
jgi:hypothetical protein